METWESTRSFYREKRTLRTVEAHVEPFTRAFMEIDQNSDGVITKADLQRFVRKNNLVEDEMVESWMRLFDGCHTETITLSAYLDRLGLQQPKDNEPHRDTRQPNEEKSPHGSSSVRIVTVNMVPEDQAAVLQKVREITASSDNQARLDESAVTKELKKWLESRYGRTWHVIIIRGSYWMNFSHEPDFSFQFEMGPYVYAMWRTPVL
ncbi:unnamed protein product [Schistocephalus solidus]|uniref:EF-hand domain-containing protein n=1 Tax=Schistocephalus solidus TaxID=70667 RepID=A0A183SXM8_SCHSO|nr:unnamed protein product [Schistocephalus solidus]